MKTRNWLRMEWKLGLAVATCLLPVLPAGAQNYQKTVKRLQPTYYYELNETDTSGGVVDSMGNAPNGTYNGDYLRGNPMVGGPGPLVVFNPDDPAGTPVPGLGGEENLAHYSNNEGHIVLGDGNLFAASSMTVALFFKADFAQGGDRLFTNNVAGNNFQVNVANEGMVIATQANTSGATAERTLRTEDGSDWDRRLIRAESGWFHVVASTHGTGAQRAENIRLWINGVERTENLAVTNWGWGIDTEMAKIGGRHADPRATTTHSGAQDEVAIWLDRVLTEEEVMSIWNAAITTEPQRVNKQITAVGDELVIKWKSAGGKLYNLRSETDIAAGDPFDWPIYDDRMDMEATPPENSLTLPLPTDSERFFVIEEFNAPPVEVFSDAFENGQGDWTVGSEGAEGTAWELGTPSAVGPPAANSPENCWATNISADYGLDAAVWLRSPAIDLTTAGGATLKYFEWKDIEEGFDSGRVTVIDAADNSELAVIADVVDGVAGWGQVTESLPAEALGKNVKIEFRLTSDDLQSFAGWYIDDVVVTVP